jgi:uncharacterized protein
MRQRATVIHRILLLVLFPLAGCFSLGRDPPPPQDYVLGRVMSRGDDPVSSGTLGVTVGVRRLQLAPYLSTPYIVVRRGPHRITYSEFHRWGEDLGGGINRTVAAYLASRAPSLRLDVAPWPLRSQHDYLIQLHVLRFEGLAPEEPSASEGEVYVLATWEVMREQDGEVVKRGRTEYRSGAWSVEDYTGLVALLDAGLETVAGELATSLEALVTHP